MTRIEPPHACHREWSEALVLASACHVLQQVHARPGIIATYTREQFDTWRAAIRIHRDAWREADRQAVTNVERTYSEMRRQGIAAGWWTEPDPVPGTPFVPLLHPDDTASIIINELGPDVARQWTWELARAVRHHTSKATT